MASISNDPNGRRRILFVGSDGKRKPLRLGKVSQRHAESVKRHVEELVAALNCNRTPEDATSRWVASLADGLHAKLAKLELVRARESLTLGGLVDGWLKRRSPSLRPGTVVRLQQGRRSLIQYFGKDRTITNITEGEVEDYRAALLAEKLAEATVRKRCSDARVWFRYAQRHGYIQSNPFEVVPTAAIATTKLRYICEADAQRVLAEIADPDLRLIFVLSRWGGLRIVSEPKAMTWDCIDWAQSKVVVKSPKTDRHAGHEQRVIPMFPELVGPLQDAFDRAEPGEDYVLPKLQIISSAALRKPLLAAIKRAGLTAWPRLWHNLRASRQTDLESRFPSHVVCAWLGNSAAIARRHYLQVLDRDYAKAITGKAAQNAAQKVHETARNASKLIGPQTQKNPDSSEVFDDLPVVADVPSDPYGI